MKFTIQKSGACPINCLLKTYSKDEWGGEFKGWFIMTNSTTGLCTRRIHVKESIHLKPNAPVFEAQKVKVHLPPFIAVIGSPRLDWESGFDKGC